MAKKSTTTKKLSSSSSPFFDIKIILGVLVLLLLALSLVVMVVFPGGLDNRGEAASYRWWRSNMGPGSKLCSTEYAPVCGKDGKTYNNLCLAYRAGVPIAKQGACDNNRAVPSPVMQKETENTTADQKAEEEKNPLFCIDVVKPVCGFDGKTYNNECNAKREGVAVKCEGTCPCGSTTRGGVVPIGY